MLEIVVVIISELVEFVGSVLFCSPKGFRSVLTFALKTSISHCELI